VSTFLAWLRSRSVAPAIAALYSRAETIRQEELARFLGRLGPLSQRERQQLEALTHGLVNRLLHQPTVRLKEKAASPDGRLYARAMCELFDLPVQGLDGSEHASP